jgi:ribosomal protein L22
MTFSTKVRSSVVRHCLLRAINRADFYHGLTADSLKVAEAFTGKGLTAPRIRHHGRGAYLSAWPGSDCVCDAVCSCSRVAGHSPV